MNNEVSFGAWLRQRRKILDLTQEDLASRVGCSVSAIRKIEADERRPSRQIAALLAECLEIPPEERPTFLKVVRAEVRVDRLAPAIPDGYRAVSLPRGKPAQEAPSAGSAPAGRAGARPKERPALPAPLTPLVGREPELAALHRLLNDPGCRLLTLIGPGGIGKTRLAIQAAQEQQEAFEDGACFVSLAPLSSGEFIVPAIADSLSFDFTSPGEPKAQLLDYLRGKRMLLVLDNLEHLVAEAGLLAEMLQRAPQVKLLVTSRERLNLQGEWIFEIHGLPAPPSTLSSNHLENYSAVALFLQSARRVRPGFALDSQNRSQVIRICQLLEGMPLGIELAAAWVRLLSTGEIAEEIERNLDFLATSLRDVPERHRSLRAAFDHSWNLLSPEEAAALRQASVFRGSFQRQAAQEVLGASLPLLSALVDQSLLRLNEADRYDMHELVRQYAAGKLEAFPQEQAGVQERHADYYLRFIRQREDLFTRERQAVEQARAELENVRAAWQHSLAHGRLNLVGEAAEGLAGFYRQTGLLREGEKAFASAVERARLAARNERQTRQILAKLHAVLAGILNDRGLHPQAAETAERAIRLAQEAEEARSEALGHLEWGLALWRQSDFPAARQQLERSLELARRWGWPPIEAESRRVLGVVALLEGYLPEAMRELEEALRICRSIGDRWRESEVLNRLGMAFFTRGDLGQSLAHYEQALQVFLEVGDRRGEGRALNNLGVVFLTAGDLPRARLHFEKGLEIMRETGDRGGESASLANLGIAHHRLGDFAAAQAHYRLAFEVSREIGEKGGEVGGLTNLGLLAYHQGDCESAQEYHRQALELARENGLPLMESFALLRLGRIYLDERNFSSAEGAFRRSLELRREVRRIPLTAEPLAGLAELSLTRQEPQQTLAYAEELLSVLARSDCHLLDEADDPYWIYLACFRALQAAGDGRAVEVLAAAGRALDAQLAAIPQESTRREFLERLPSRREVLAELEKARPRQAPPARRKRPS